MVKSTKTTSRAVRPRTAPPSSSPLRTKESTQNPNPDSQVQAYQVALTKPFDTRAYGARVPDLWSAPTTTHHIRKLVTLTTDSNGTITGLVMPSIFCHSVLTQGAFNGSGAATWTRWDGTTVSSAVLYTDQSSVKAKISNARIVSYGIRFRNQTSLSNVSGRFTLATLPIKDDMLCPSVGAVGGFYTSNVSDTVGQWFAAAGVPNDGGGAGAVIDASQFPNLPNNLTLSSLQMNETGLDVVPKVITPYAFGLKNTTDSQIGNDVGPGIATGNIYAGDDDYVKFGGFESVLFTASGLPASTQAMTMEIIYHVEGTPTLSGSGGLVPDTQAKAHVSLASFHKVLDYAAKAATFVSPGLSGLATSVKNLSNLPLL